MSKQRHCHSKTMRDYFVPYQKSVPTNHQLPLSLYNKVLIAFFRKIFERVFYENLIIELPLKLGTFFMKKNKGRPIDKEQSAKFKKKVVLHNYHSDGYVFKFNYKSHSQRVSTYRFVLTGKIKQECYRHIIALGTDPTVKDYGLKIPTSNR